MSGAPEHVISIRGLVNRFGRQAVHDGLDLDVRRDEVLAVVGGSGTGKSVLLRSILGLHQPNAGTISVLGQPIRYLEPGPHTPSLSRSREPPSHFSWLVAGWG